MPAIFERVETFWCKLSGWSKYCMHDETGSNTLFSCLNLCSDSNGMNLLTFSSGSPGKPLSRRVCFATLTNKSEVNRLVGCIWWADQVWICLVVTRNVDLFELVFLFSQLWTLRFRITSSCFPHVIILNYITDWLPRQLQIKKHCTKLFPGLRSLSGYHESLFHISRSPRSLVSNLGIDYFLLLRIKLPRQLTTLPTDLDKE